MKKLIVAFALMLITAGAVHANGVKANCDVTQAACALAKKQAHKLAFVGKLAPTDHSKMACVRVAVYGPTEIVLYKGKWRKDGNVPQGIIMSSVRKSAAKTQQYSDAGVPIQEFCFQRSLVLQYLESIPQNKRKSAKMTICNGEEVNRGYHHEINFENMLSLATTGHAKGYFRLLKNKDAAKVKSQFERDDYQRRHL